jgi:HSP20 family protein
MAQTMTRWQPFAELADLRSRFDRMFADITDGEHGAWTPAIDVVRRDGELCIRAELPGIKPEDVEVEVSDDVLTISGRHEEEHETKDERYVRRERRFGSFTRSIALPAGVDASSIGARSHHGVLEITVPLPAVAEHTTVRIVPEAA